MRQTEAVHTYLSAPQASFGQKPRSVNDTLSSPTKQHFQTILNREFPPKVNKCTFHEQKPSSSGKKVLIQNINVHPMNRLAILEASSNGE